MFGFHRRVRRIETDQGPVPGPPIPPREIQQPLFRRRYTLLNIVASPHANAVPYHNIAPTVEYFAISVNIWRCRNCHHQWNNAADLHLNFAGVHCPHCNLPMQGYHGLLRCHRTSLLAPSHRRLMLFQYQNYSCWSVLTKHHYLSLRLFPRRILDRQVGHLAQLTGFPLTRSPFLLWLHRLWLCQPDRSIHLERCQLKIQSFPILTFQERYQVS